MVGEALFPLGDQVKIATKFGWDIDPIRASISVALTISPPISGPLWMAA